MIKMKSIFLQALLLITLIFLSLPRTGHAVPAAPIVHTLTQPDGSTFKARQWGDENLHGWETEDGYSIVFDDSLKCWTYAVHDVTGSLTSSRRIVKRDPLPDNLMKHLRPTDQALETVPKKRLSKELQAPFSGKGVSPSGTANIPVILVNFTDRTTATVHQPAEFNTLLFGTGNYSMKDYYEEVSYGAFSVSAGPSGIAGWYTADNIHDYYGANDSQGNDLWPGDLVYEAVAAADAAFDFAPYDQDGDGYVDVVAIVHQGTGEEASPTPTDIWSHRWDLYSASYFGHSNYGEYTTNDFANGKPVKVNGYIIQPEVLDNQISTMGVFAHEYGHSFGLPDLYDTDGSSEGIGYWSLMASGSWNGVARSGDRPAHMDAWCKYFLGWVNPTLVSGTLTNQPIKQAETYSDVYQLLSGSPSTGTGEYFLVENRQKTGFDVGLPRAGLLIWHIDESMSSNDKEWYPGCTLPYCTPFLHYHVALEQADNLYNLENKNNMRNSGDAGDPYPGTMNNTFFTASSSPSSNLYSGSASNVSITDISAPGSQMTATLSANSSSSCTYSISPVRQSFDANGGNSGISVKAPAGCAWSATSNASWISITSGSNGTGNGVVNYFVSANTGTSSRTGTMTVAGQTFTITQSGGSTCTYSISPASQSFNASGGTGNVSVTVPTGCNWTATSNDSWISITSGKSGTGSGTINYSVSSNTATSSRTGTMTIADKVFTVTQEGISECSSWSDVITRYNAYVAGTVTWADVINCYTLYATK